MAMPRKLCCEVEKIEEHGGRIYTVDLIPTKKVPRFLPGQFLHLALDEYEPGNFWPESRVFSIASSPSQLDRLRISYSVVGRFTKRMETELYVGQRVWVKLPYGEFTVKGEGNVGLFAGGTGITAFTAFISTLPPEYPQKVVLFYGARQEELLLYRDLIDECAQRVPHFNVYYFVEKPPEVLSQWKFKMELGCLSVSAVWSLLPKPEETDYYLSGPPKMIETITTDLMKRSVPVSAIKFDAWT
jgi:ferredoxin-NADP reductase